MIQTSGKVFVLHNKAFGMVIGIISIFPRWPPSICASAASLLSDNIICGINKSIVYE